MEDKKQEMAICLWYNNEAEEAVNWYASIFKNSEIGSVSRYGKEGFEFHKMPEGTVMTMTFELNGMSFFALNGGSHFTFNEATSIVVYCDTQEEIDHYWDALTKEGKESSCGWLKDKFGVSWQIVPSILSKLMSGKNAAKSQNVVAAFMQMKKFDIQTLQDAYDNA